MRPALIVILAVVSFLGVGLLVASVLIGVWMKRANRGSALKTWIGAALSALIAFFSLLGALAMTAAIAAHRHSQVDYMERHPLPLFLVVGMYLVALLAACAFALFCVLTLWRLVQAPPAQPVRTNPAT